MQKPHCPTIVFAISEDPALDQKKLMLVEALKQIVGRSMGTAPSSPARLNYVIYEDEWQLVAEPFRKGTIPRIERF